MRPNLEPAELPADAVEVGRVIGAWGVQGWFKVLPYSARPEALFSSRRWYLLPPIQGLASFETPVLLPIREAREHADVIVASAHELDGRDVAQALRGARVFVPRSSFPTTAADEYYWVDLLGMAVLNRQGVHLGVVSDLLTTGPQTVLVLRDPQGLDQPERMIPFVSAYIDSVDQVARKILVDWMLDY